MIPALLTAVWNETLTQSTSDLIGGGMSYAFGNPLIIGIFALFALFGTLYALGFTIDVTMIILTAALLSMASLPSIVGSFPVLPNWMGAIPLFITAALLVFAAMKIFRR